MESLLHNKLIINFQVLNAYWHVPGGAVLSNAVRLGPSPRIVPSVTRENSILTRHKTRS